jgi:hypothetical protein
MQSQTAALRLQSDLPVSTIRRETDCHYEFCSVFCDTFSYKWTVPLTVVTASSSPSDWDGRPTDWLNIDDTGWLNKKLFGYRD